MIGLAPDGNVFFNFHNTSEISSFPHHAFDKHVNKDNFKNKQVVSNAFVLEIFMSDEVHTKGPLISKCPFGVFKLTKKPTKFL
jgi:hypothetical protein